MDILASSLTRLEKDCKELEPKLRTEKERLTFLTSKLHRLIAEEINFLPEKEILINGERELKNCKEELQALANEYKNVQNERNEICTEKHEYNEPLLERQNRELKLKNGEIKDLLQEINNLNNLIAKSAKRNENSLKKHKDNLMDISLNYEPNFNFKANTLRLLADNAKSAMELAKSSYLETREIVKDLEKRILLYQNECETVEAALYREQANQLRALEHWYYKEKEKEDLLGYSLKKEELKLHSLKHSLKKLMISLKTHENHNSNSEAAKIEQCLQKLRELKSGDSELDNKITRLCDRSQSCFRIFREKFKMKYALISSQINEIKEHIALENDKINNDKKKILLMQKNHSLEIKNLQNYTPKNNNGRYRMKLKDMKQLFVQLNEKFLDEERKLNFSREDFVKKQQSCHLLEKQVDELEIAITEFKHKKTNDLNIS